MKKSIFSKIFSSFCLIILTVSILILISSFFTIKQYYIKSLSNDLKRLSYSLKLNLIPTIEEKNYEKLDKKVKKIGKDINTRITIIAPNGKVLADSKKNPNLMENHGGRPEVIEALKKGFGRSLRYSTTMKKKMLYIATPIKSNGKLLGILRVSLFLKDINKLLNNLEIKIFLITLIIIFLSLFGAYIFSKNLSNPIKDLVSISKKIAKGDFSQKIILNRRDELGELSKSFNEMSEKLKTLFSDLKLKQEELNSIISSLEEGLLVLDKNGKVILYNESFKKIVKSEPYGKFWWEVLITPKINKLIKKVFKEKKNFSKEIEIDGKIFLVSFVFIPSKEEITILFHDITRFKKLEIIKKDFVSNVSHELRTPLTSIKGYVEVLEDEIKDKNHIYYLNIIRKNTERVINIVSDLLMLSELEEKGFLEKIEDVNLNEIVENVFKILRQKANEKNLRLTLDEREKIFIKGDSCKLEQMFINLIDNAIKYTEKGGVTVSLKKNEKVCIISIKDSGIGISKKHLDRIFERFYVVDKSRSKKLGGTGLGLSIVKHIVSIHGGKIEVKSTPGKGTEFKITLPLNFMGRDLKKN